MSPTDVIKIFIVEDHEIFRDGLRKHLEANPVLRVVGEADSGEEAVNQVANLNPDVVLMDIQLIGMDGLEATRQIVSRAPHSPRVIVLTGYGSDDYVYEALRAGASGFLLKDVKGQRLARDIVAMASGTSQAWPDNTRQLMAGVSTKKKRDAEAAAQVASLTPREREVLHLLVTKGLSNKGIAKELSISLDTVKGHVSRVFSKLEVDNRSQAANKVHEVGIDIPTNGTGPTIPPA